MKSKNKTFLNFTILGETVLFSLKDFHKLVKIWKKEGAEITSEHPIVFSQSKKTIARKGKK